MKRQFGKTLQHIAALTLGVFLTLGHVAQAANNQGIGDVAGVGADLTDSNVFILSSTGSGLVLVKTAFLTSGGAQLNSGDTVPSGTSVDFMIYINNESSVAISDVSIQDVLDPAFTYQSPSIKIDNSVADCGVSCDTTEEAAIYAAAIATGVLSDAAAAGDAASFAALTVDAGDSVVGANDQLDVPANKVLALVFTVVVP
jgi:uncharacterized repeat protein (TIGR01451 family)